MNPAHAAAVRAEFSMPVVVPAWLFSARASMAGTENSTVVLLLAKKIIRFPAGQVQAGEGERRRRPSLSLFQTNYVNVNNELPLVMPPGALHAIVAKECGISCIAMYKYKCSSSVVQCSTGGSFTAE